MTGASLRLMTDRGTTSPVLFLCILVIEKTRNENSRFPKGFSCKMC